MKNQKIELKWAVIFSISLLIWMFLERMVGLHDEHIDKHLVLTMLFGIPAIILYVLAIRDKKKNFYNGQMTYKEGLRSGLVLSIFIALLVPLNQIIISQLITPDYFQNAINYAVENEKMTLESAQKYFSLKNYIVQSFVWAIASGAITSGIVAFFLKSKNR